MLAAKKIGWRVFSRGKKIVGAFSPHLQGQFRSRRRPLYRGSSDPGGGEELRSAYILSFLLHILLSQSSSPIYTTSKAPTSNFNTLFNSHGVLLESLPSKVAAAARTPIYPYESTVRVMVIGSLWIACKFEIKGSNAPGTNNWKEAKGFLKFVMPFLQKKFPEEDLMSQAPKFLQEFAKNCATRAAHNSSDGGESTSSDEA
ncbi:hypothetical protein U9M48_035001 [Paspalum notatum var. saurae]|uniref:Uncharacterized protein n=1 Tax=Paspalum notatum var. saurae TaxID=547442 RepID=A0AAQ3UA78_PASNO